MWLVRQQKGLPEALVVGGVGRLEILVSIRP